MAFSPLALAEQLPEKIRFKHITMEDEAFVGAVLAIHQDVHGFIWIGGRMGVARYDGYGFQIYRHNPHDYATLAANTVHDITTDASGNLWFATEVGLDRFDYETEAFVHYHHSEDNPHSIGVSPAFSLHLDRQGLLWVGTRGGLSHYRPESDDFAHHDIQVAAVSNQAGEYVLDITDDGQGNFYLGTGYGLKVWNRHTQKTTLHRGERHAVNKLQTNLIRSVHVDRSDRIWIGSELGLHEYHPNSGIFEFYPTELDAELPVNARGGQMVSAAVWDIFEDSQGVLWVATDGFGVNWLNRETNQLVTQTNDPKDNSSLSATISRTVYEDRDGDIWIGNYPSGIDVFERYSAAFQTYINNSEDNAGFGSGNVKKILEDEHENLWLAIEGGGLNYFDTHTQTFQYLRHEPDNPNSLGSNDPLNLVIDHRGVMWIATWTSGINQYDLNTGNFRTILPEPRNPNALQSAQIWTIYEDSAHTMWVGAMGTGLYRYIPESDSFKSYLYSEEDPYSILDGQIWAIEEDSRGNLWVATQRALSRMDRSIERFTNFVSDPANPHSISSNEVRAVFEDSKGRLWLGTNGGGLNQFDYVTESFTSIGQQEGLPSDIVQAIIEDDDGNLWLGTNLGITRYNPDTGDIQSYQESYGLQGNEFNIGSVYKAKNGDLIFGGLNGFTRFNPRDILPNESIPKVKFTDIKILNEAVDIGEHSPLRKSILVADTIYLDHKQNIVEFEFAALSFRDSKKNQYAYKLEGFDKDWYYVDQKRNATYTNLDGGEYIFHVKAANNEGVWNETDSGIRIVVSPPAWKTWWAYTLYALFISSAVLAYVIFLRKINKRLETMVGVRTEELEQVNIKLEKASLSDPLTGLANRRFMDRFIYADIAQVNRQHDDWRAMGHHGTPPKSDIAFFLIDVDHFKSINDNYGHSAGDHVLITMSKLLREINREASHVIRWGGEEFLLVSRFVEGSQTSVLADRILTRVRETPFVLENGQAIHITVSIGFSLLPYSRKQKELMDWQRTVDIADLALYTAKNSGRNGWVGTNFERKGYHNPDEFLAAIERKEVSIQTSFTNSDNLVWE